jgi:hypothetical protein
LTICPGSRSVFFNLLKEPRYEDYKIVYQSDNEFQFLGNGFHMMEFNGGDNSFYLGARGDEAQSSSQHSMTLDGTYDS